MDDKGNFTQSEKEHSQKENFNSEKELSQKDTSVIGINEFPGKDTISTTNNKFSGKDTNITNNNELSRQDTYITTNNEFSQQIKNCNRGNKSNTTSPTCRKIIQKRNPTNIRRKHVRFTDHSVAKAQEYETCLVNHNILINNNINSSKGSSLISLPVKTLIGHKQNNKIPKQPTPRRTFCLKRSLTNPDVGIYVALEDQWIDECSPERKEELIAFWQKRLYLSRERTLATLRNTTQMVGLLHSEHARHLLNDFKKCRAPQLGSRRTPGTTYTDTTFASVTSWDGANAFQVHPWHYLSSRN